MKRNEDFSRFAGRKLTQSGVVLVGMVALLAMCAVLSSETGSDFAQILTVLVCLLIPGIPFGWFFGHLLHWSESISAPDLELPKPHPRRVKIQQSVTWPAKKKRNGSLAGAEVVYTFQGKGSQASDAIDLEPGLYRIRYSFSDDTKTGVILVSLHEHIRRDILNHRSGTGSATFGIEEGDRFVFEVTIPGGLSRRWQFEVERL
jgi:hypothetical protein